jgi:hypothetical protein
LGERKGEDKESEGKHGHVALGLIFVIILVLLDMGINEDLFFNFKDLFGLPPICNISEYPS